MLNYFPKYFTSKSIYLYIGVLFVCNFIFFAHFLPVIWWVFGLIEVLSFFYFSNLLTKEWGRISEKSFLSKIFITALLLRLLWVAFSYIFYQLMTGQPFEFNAGDSFGYHGTALWIVELIKQNSIQEFYDYINGRYSDFGYPYFLGLQYWVTGQSIIIARIIKALLGAYVCVLIYKLAKRVFGDGVARMAAIFCMLMPNLIYYSGLHAKESEMVFLTILFVERGEDMLRNKNFDVLNIVIVLFVGVSLFFFRTVLGATALFSFFSALVLSSNKVLGMGKRTLLMVWVVIAMLYFAGGKLATEVENIWETRTTNQESSLKFRTERVNGNSLAKYASSAIFVPMIFALPFPTVVNTPQQENQQLINGGNFVKNIMAFFVIFSMFWIFKNKKWREYVFLGSFIIGYLVVIAFSAFAQSERFHQPVLPLILLMSAFGISVFSNKEKKYFMWYLALLFVIMIVWSWYKLAGRGMI